MTKFNIDELPELNANGKPIKTKKDKQMKKANNAKQAYTSAVKLHKQEVAKLKRDIKKHKLLIKQAKITYKLSK